MRGKILIVVLGVPLLVVFSLVCMDHVARVSQQGVEAVRAIETDLFAGEPEAALEKTLALTDRWERQEALLQLWVCHTDTDEVRQRLLLVRAGLEAQSRQTVLENTALLQEAFLHLHHVDDVTWSNIL